MEGICPTMDIFLASITKGWFDAKENLFPVADALRGGIDGIPCHERGHSGT